MQLIIGGDLMPTQSNTVLFRNSNIIDLLGEELLRIWNLADIRIFNLEAPIADKESPIDKCGPNLIIKTNNIYGVKALNPSLIALANNHIFDHGEYGLKSTKRILKEFKIPFVGAGVNLDEAIIPLIFEFKELKIGIYACAEHEFSIATESTPGANPFDPLESLDHIQVLKVKCDYVIVLYHGGKEHYRYPSPYLQKVCRKMVNKGADVVICQHSHCIGCYEEYGDSFIIYGQGNFIFDNSECEYWKTGLLIKLDISNKMDIDFIPIIKKGNVIRLATGEEAQAILSDFKNRSNKILNENFIEKKYQEFSIENIQFYLRHFSGLGKWISRFDNRLLNGMILKKKYNKAKLLAIENFIKCESHRELVLMGLNNKGKK